MRDRTKADADPESGDQAISKAGAATDIDPADATAPSSGVAEARPQIAGAQDIEFTLASDIIYHRARQAFLAGAHRWLMFGVIVSGAAAASTLNPGACGLIAAMLGAADIAFDFAGRAQAHADVARRHNALAARFSDGASRDDIWRGFLEISADEPETYRLAYFVAHNEAVFALGRGEPVALTFWQRLRANFARA